MWFIVWPHFLSTVCFLCKRNPIYGEVRSPSHTSHHELHYDSLLDYSRYMALRVIFRSVAQGLCSARMLSSRLNWVRGHLEDDPERVPSCCIMVVPTPAVCPSMTRVSVPWLSPPNCHCWPEVTFQPLILYYPAWLPLGTGPSFPSGGMRFLIVSGNHLLSCDYYLFIREFV